MKKLILYRHAKSSWSDPFLDDHDRPLAERGLRDAPRMAQRLKRRDIRPDLLVSSDAIRAKATTLITAENLHFPKEQIVFTSQLYHASSAQILKLIRQFPYVKNTILLFGHNPGFNDLIDRLGGNIDNLPTCGQFGFTFNVEDWAQVAADNASTWFVDYPKKS